MSLSPTPLRLTVTGQSGQVVTALAAAAPQHGMIVTPLGRPDLDLADPTGVDAALAATRPDVIVNAAAYTAVDKAEAEPDLARTVNALGAEAVARCAARLGLPVIQISTDYVFGDFGDQALTERDAPGPLNMYGRTKWEGETRVAAATANHAILRTSWVHAPFGANFVRSMLRLAANRDEIRIVADQHGSPTSALDIAEGIVAVARNLHERPSEAGLRGVFHMTASGYTTWAAFAEAIFAASASYGGPTAKVIPITTAEYPTAATRPLNSRLDCSHIAATHGVRLPDWRSSIEPTVERLLAQA